MAADVETDCGKILTLRRSVATASTASTAAEKLLHMSDNSRRDLPSRHAAKHNLTSADLYSPHMPRWRFVFFPLTPQASPGLAFIPFLTAQFSIAVVTGHTV